MEPWLTHVPLTESLKFKIDKSLNKAISILQTLEAEIVDSTDVPSAVDGSLWDCMRGARSLIVQSEFKEDMDRYLNSTKGLGGCESIEDVVRCVIRRPFLCLLRRPTSPDL